MVMMPGKHCDLKSPKTLHTSQSGACKQVGTRVLVMPGSHAASVRAVQVNGAPAALARAGDAVEVCRKLSPFRKCAASYIFSLELLGAQGLHSSCSSS